MSKGCPTCGRPGSEGGVCSNGYHIEEAYKELEEAKELLGRMGRVPTPEYIAEVQAFFKRLRENAAAKPILDEYTGGDAVIKLPGSTLTFRCHCGGNVFSKHATAPLKYRCNSCETLYEGEK